MRSTSCALSLVAVLGFSLASYSADKQLERELKQRYEGRIVRLYLMPEQQFQLKLPKEDKRGADQNTRIYVKVEGVELGKTRMRFQARRVIPYVTVNNEKQLAAANPREYRVEWAGTGLGTDELLKGIERHAHPVVSVENDWPDYWATLPEQPSPSKTSTEPEQLKLRRAADKVEPPECEVCFEPEYMDEPKRGRIQGVVVLHTVIAETGQACSIRVNKSLHPQLDAAAALAVGRWLFRPAMKGGRAVPAKMTVEVNFRLF